MVNSEPPIQRSLLALGLLVKTTPGILLVGQCRIPIEELPLLLPEPLSLAVNSPLGLVVVAYNALLLLVAGGGVMNAVVGVVVVVTMTRAPREKVASLSLDHEDEDEVPLCFL